MTTIKLALFALIVLGPSVFLYAKKGLRAEYTLAPVLCAQSLALLALGLFLPLSACVGLLAGASLLLMAWGGVLLLRQGVRRALGFLSLPLLFFLATLIPLYNACSARLFLSADEYSHWGLLVKAIAVFDELPRAGAGAAYVQYTYPPALAMMPAMAAKLLGYKDGIAYFGYALLLEGLLLGVAGKAKRGAMALLGAAVSYLCLMAIFPMGITRLFCEPAVALLMALLLVRSLSGASLFERLLYACMLALSKNTGLAFAAIALFGAWFAKPDRKAGVGALKLFGASVACSFAWRAYCAVHGIKAVLSQTHFGETFAALMNGTLDANYMSIPARYAQFFFTEKLPAGGVYATYGFGTCALVFAMVLALCALHVLMSDDRRRALRLWAGVWAMNLLYVAMIVCGYFVGFNYGEVESLSEADRYTVLVALWTGLMACGMLFEQASSARRLRQAAAIGAASAMLFPLSHPQMTVKTFITCDYVNDTIWARDLTDRVALFLRLNLGYPQGATMLGMGDYPHSTLHHVLMGEIAVGKSDVSWGKAPWQGDAEAVRAAMSERDYVFVGGLMEGYGEAAVDSRYDVLTADGAPLRANTLYRVTRDASGRALLERIASMDEWVNPDA